MPLLLQDILVFTNAMAALQDVVSVVAPESSVKAMTFLRRLKRKVIAYREDCVSWADIAPWWKSVCKRISSNAESFAVGAGSKSGPVFIDSWLDEMTDEREELDRSLRNKHGSSSSNATSSKDQPSKDRSKESASKDVKIERQRKELAKLQGQKRKHDDDKDGEKEGKKGRGAEEAKLKEQYPERKPLPHKSKIGQWMTKAGLSKKEGKMPCFHAFANLGQGGCTRKGCTFYHPPDE